MHEFRIRQAKKVAEFFQKPRHAEETLYSLNGDVWRFDVHLWQANMGYLSILIFCRNKKDTKTADK